jgi:hypothetical protein
MHFHLVPDAYPHGEALVDPAEGTFPEEVAAVEAVRDAAELANAQGVQLHGADARLPR